MLPTAVTRGGLLATFDSPSGLVKCVVPLCMAFVIKPIVVANTILQKMFCRDCFPDTAFQGLFSRDCFLKIVFQGLFSRDCFLKIVFPRLLSECFAETVL